MTYWMTSVKKASLNDILNDVTLLSYPRIKAILLPKWSLNALSFSQLVKIPNKFTQFERKLGKITGVLNSKNFHSMHIMQDLPTNKANFLFKNTLDFNQTTHVGPQEPIVLIDNINLYLNCLSSVKDVLKCSCHAHILLFSVTSQCMLNKPQKYFLQNKNTSIFLSRKHNISRMNWLDLLSIPACLQLSKVFHVQNNWVLLIYAFCILQLNALWKISLHILRKMVLLVISWFSKWHWVNCKYLFP